MLCISHKNHIANFFSQNVTICLGFLCCLSLEHFLNLVFPLWIVLDINSFSIISNHLILIQFSLELSFPLRIVLNDENSAIMKEIKYKPSSVPAFSSPRQPQQYP